VSPRLKSNRPKYLGHGVLPGVLVAVQQRVEGLWWNRYQHAEPLIGSGLKRSLKPYRKRLRLPCCGAVTLLRSLQRWPGHEPSAIVCWGVRYAAVPPRLDAWVLLVSAKSTGLLRY